MSNRGWIAIDLDGTLAQYDKWVSIYHIGEPIPAMLNRVIDWLEAGEDVRIFTARVSAKNSSKVEAIVKKWCLKHIGKELPVTCVKDMNCRELWDDRAIRVVKNTGMPCCG